MQYSHSCVFYSIEKNQCVFEINFITIFLTEMIKFFLPKNMCKFQAQIKENTEKNSIS